MSMLNVLANQHAAMMPDEYKHRSDDEMKQRVLEIKRAFGSKLFIPGHHYQKDEVIEFADATGDSLQLAQIAADNHEAEYIVFCGVHFIRNGRYAVKQESKRRIARYESRLFHGRYGKHETNRQSMGAAH